MPLFDHFDRIRIINLPQRSDRRREMARELARAGLADDPRVGWFDAIRPASKADFTSIGARGVFLSQQAILREAAAAGEAVLILEDDCHFAQGVRDYAPSSDWEIFYGGYYATNPGDLAASDIVGAHMMGFSRAGAKLASAFLETLGYTGTHPPIDAAYVWLRRQHPEIRSEFAVPVLAVQRSSPSDIAPAKWHHRVPLGRQAARLVRWLRDRG